MAEKQLWLEPDYFVDFHCKGGDCRNSCCSGWDIAVSQRDYFRLIGMDCPPELHHRLECAFKAPDYPTPEHFRLISPNWLGRCPLQDEDGLCALHRNCGEMVLPEICRVYPRSLKREGTNLQACCSNSCEAVVEMLMEKDRLSFSMMEMEAEAEIGGDADERMVDSIRRCVELLQDRSKPLSERVGAICLEIAPEKTFVTGEAALTKLMDILSEMRFSESRNLCEYGAAAFERYQGESAWENFRADALAMNGSHPLWQRHFENVLANHIVYEDFPYADPRVDPRDACAGFCLLYSAMTAVTAAYTRVHGESGAFADAVAGLFHLVEHSSFYYNARVLTQDEWILI